MMFGQNPIAKPDHHSDGQQLRVVQGSPFLTLQGEGPYAGHRAIFVRLHGCNLACTFCDTQFSDPNDPTWRIGELIHHIVRIRPTTNLVVITGGEPMRQNILPLCTRLHELKFRVQIETAGTLWIPELYKYAELVVSPKTPTIHPQVLLLAKAFKYIIDVNDQFDVDDPVPITATQANTKPRKLAAPRKGAPVYLSPCDTGDLVHNQQNMSKVADLALRFNAIAGVQLHKILNIEEPS